MINFEALFSLSYGLYIVTAGDKKHGNGFISNTVFQVTSEPAKFASCCSKENYTTQLIKDSGYFVVSVLHQETDPKVYGKFGYRTGKDIKKLEGSTIKYGISGTPIVLDDTIAFLECKVIDTIDVGTHLLFIGELIDAELFDTEKEPLTYAYYRKVKKGIAPKNAPTYIDKSKLENKKEDTLPGIYKCTVCGHIYDENIEDDKFTNLPDSWKCPVCGAGKEDFEKVE